MTAPYTEFAKSRVMLIAAPNGARRGQEEHAALPLDSDAIARCAAALLEQQVSVLHLHVRDATGAHTLDEDIYRGVLAAIHRAVGNELIVQVTSEAVGRYRPEQQMQLVRSLRPEAVSLALRELCADEAGLSEAAVFFAELKSAGTWPQYILYDPDDVGRFDRLRRQGVFSDDHPHALFVLGRYAQDQQGKPAELQAMLGAADCSEWPWSVCCFGAREHAAAMQAYTDGGHVRLGFENNLLLADGRVARDNAALFAQFNAAIDCGPRRPATADEVRAGLLAN